MDVFWLLLIDLFERNLGFAFFGLRHWVSRFSIHCAFYTSTLFAKTIKIINTGYCTFFNEFFFPYCLCQFPKFILAVLFVPIFIYVL